MTNQKKIKYINFETAKFLHEKIINIGPNQVSTLGRPELLDSALAEVQAGYGDFERYPTLHEKAACYLFHIAKNHAFSDGNKRLGLNVALTFLELNGISVKMEENDLLTECAIRAVENTLNKEQLAIIFDILITASIRQPSDI